MSIRDHRRKAAGKRMPRPTSCKMGTQIHESKQKEEPIEIDQCEYCGKYVEKEELMQCDYHSTLQGLFLCCDCTKEAESHEDDFWDEMYKDSMND